MENIIKKSYELIGLKSSRDIKINQMRYVVSQWFSMLCDEEKGGGRWIC
jgi:hypothetical protein